MPVPMDQKAALDAILKKHKGENKAVQPDLVEDTDGEMDDLEMAAGELMDAIHNKNPKIISKVLKAFMTMHSMQGDEEDDLMDPEDYPAIE